MVGDPVEPHRGERTEVRRVEGRVGRALLDLVQVRVARGVDEELAFADRDRLPVVVERVAVDHVVVRRRMADGLAHEEHVRHPYGQAGEHDDPEHDEELLVERHVSA